MVGGPQKTLFLRQTKTAGQINSSMVLYDEMGQMEDKDNDISPKDMHAVYPPVACCTIGRPSELRNGS